MEPWLLSARRAAQGSWGKIWGIQRGTPS